MLFPKAELRVEALGVFGVENDLGGLPQSRMIHDTRHESFAQAFSTSLR